MGTIKSVLSMISLAVLAIQHYVGLWADNIQVSYIPLLITFSIIFTNTLGESSLKVIRYISLLGMICIAIAGIILYTMSGYEISLSLVAEQRYNRVLFFIIGTVSLSLSIFYVKRICEESRKGVLG